MLDPAGDRLSAGAMATAMCRLVAAQYFVIVSTRTVVIWNANERLFEYALVGCSWTGSVGVGEAAEKESPYRSK